MVLFEFDDTKSKANQEKHGIDFEAAQELWNDPDLLEIQARSEEECRWLVIGRIGEKNWSAVVRYREEELYES